MALFLDHHIQWSSSHRSPLQPCICWVYSSQTTCPGYLNQPPGYSSPPDGLLAPSARDGMKRSAQETESPHIHEKGPCGSVGRTAFREVRKSILTVQLFPISHCKSPSTLFTQHTDARNHTPTTNTHMHVALGI